jgi:hypothetical protein
MNIQSRFVGYMERIIYDLNWIVPEDIPRKISHIVIEGIKSTCVIFKNFNIAFVKSEREIPRRF